MGYCQKISQNREYQLRAPDSECFTTEYLAVQYLTHSEPTPGSQTSKLHCSGMIKSDNFSNMNSEF